MIKEQFQGLAERAGNLGRGRKAYEKAMFRADFPQFFEKTEEGEEPRPPLLPPAVLEGFLAQASAAIQPEKWRESWRWACGLYTAHNAVLFLRTYRPEGSASPAEAAASGALVGVVSSAKLGQDSVSFNTGALTEATAGWGDLNATQYGQLLAARARLAGMGGSYVI